MFKIITLNPPLLQNLR